MKHILSGILLVLSVSASAQYVQYRVTGRLLDPDAEPVSGAVVRHVGSHMGMISTPDGSFQMTFKDPGTYIIQISHISYETIYDTVEVTALTQRYYNLKYKSLLTDEHVIRATRAQGRTPATYEMVTREELDQVNLAQDLPVLLNQSVSVISTSDAGAGVGYTGLRIRGSDATRVNVTVNGIPLNDAESHGVFWVNMPDFASSSTDIQIQRGVGTSSNGAGAFGASVNILTMGADSVAFAEINNSYGSFETRRHNVILNSGLLGGHWNFEARASAIASEGYIDRSAARLYGGYFAGGYYGKKVFSRVVAFGGRERTQQAWYGTPESRLNGSDPEMVEHAMRNGYTAAQTANLLSSGRTFNHYIHDNEIDRYAQDHIQWINGFQITPSLYINLSAHYTGGKGYFEQYKYGAALGNYGLTAPPADSVTHSDLTVRRWLDNKFAGAVYSVQYQRKTLRTILGGAANRYLGDHFGEVIGAGFNPDLEATRYYFSDALKDDISSYLRTEYEKGKTVFYADVQYRLIAYRTKGTDNDLRAIDVKKTFHFINPKLGMSYSPSAKNVLYFTLARGSREPVRSDFIDAIPGQEPKPEFLNNLEAGWTYSGQRMLYGFNGYVMHYQNQLVLTGAVNDVGAPVRTNVPNSQRIGVETYARMNLGNGFYWQPNMTISQNKITRFNEIVYDYTEGFEEVTIQHENTDIAFSPSFMAASQIGFRTKYGLHLALRSKFVGEQYMDNTSSRDRMLPAYHFHDFLLSYSPGVNALKKLEFTLMVNNLLNHMYSTNGYTFGYIYEGRITENFYYPQAGTNWLLGVKLRL